MIKAALFDLDGVVFETESQYTIFWGMIGREYHPEMPDFAHRIKGQTLVQIYDKYFSDAQTFAHIEGFTSVAEEQAKITVRLDEYERNMAYMNIKLITRQTCPCSSRLRLSPSQKEMVLKAEYIRFPVSESDGR